ncbi:MAG: DUF4062 domain-containing protein [Defluviicoccus sp.]
MPSSPENLASGMNIPSREIGSVFLSATVKDLRHYRDEVQSALRGIRVTVFLQEEWNEASGRSVNLCLQRLDEADGYVGVFGFRYGWIPSGRDVSITELECLHAFERWPHEPPPIFLFLPQQGSEAAIELEGYADEALASDYSSEPDERADSKKRQRDFCNRLRNSERFIRDFSTLAELRERSICVVYTWSLRVLKEALAARPAAGSRGTGIPASELGEIDREAQRDAIHDALQALRRRPEVPAMCLVIQGEETAGHSAFLDWLSHWDIWEISRDFVPVTPPHDHFDASSLIAAAISNLAGGLPGSAAGVGALAEVVLRRLDKEPVVLTLSALHRLQGGLEAFHAGFWRPLFEALRVKWQLKMATHRLEMAEHRLVLLVDWREFFSAEPADLLWPGDPAAPNVDYSLLLPLPPLEPFRPIDVEAWLRRLGMQGRQCREIAERVTRGATPLLVFERLNGEGFWDELARGKVHG